MRSAACTCEGRHETREVNPCGFYCLRSREGSKLSQTEQTNYYRALLQMPTQFAYERYIYS
jgi:hypothetical protein